MHARAIKRLRARREFPKPHADDDARQSRDDVKFFRICRGRSFDAMGSMRDVLLWMESGCRRNEIKTSFYCIEFFRKPVAKIIR